MLYRYSEVFRTGLAVADLALIAASWLGAYFVRFHTGWPAPLGVPPLEAYLPPLLVIVPLWLVLFRSNGLYEAQRMESALRESTAVLRATAMGVLLLVAITFFWRSYFYSRGVIAIFSGLAPVSVIAMRSTLRGVLRIARKRGYNLRYVVVVGAGQLAEEIVERIHARPGAGLRVIGVLADGALGRRVAGVPVVGGYDQLKPFLEGRRVDEVVIALPREEWERLEKLLAALEDDVVSVKLAPDLLHVMTLRSSVESLDGLPIINLRESPMMGWAAVQKRTFDLVAGGLLAIGASPLLAGIALAIWATSGRPILFVQRRVGLDGRQFPMVKFRTMQADAEARGGPQWAQPDDPRRTPLGAFLRRTNLDELPQLWNVLKGDMSLVGPRPERPVFIEQFRQEIPGYMLRHKVKAGLTGWAQVHGWRGQTSLHERVEHDIYYIQQWSLGLDVRILLMTLLRSFRDRNAY